MWGLELRKEEVKQFSVVQVEFGVKGVQDLGQGVGCGVEKRGSETCLGAARRGPRPRFRGGLVVKARRLLYHSMLESNKEGGEDPVHVRE